MSLKNYLKQKTINLRRTDVNSCILQSGEDDHYDKMNQAKCFEFYFTKWFKYKMGSKKQFDKKLEKSADFIENLSLFIYNLYTATGKGQRISAILGFLKMCIKRSFTLNSYTSIIVEYYHSLFESDFQSVDAVHSLRDLLENYNTVKESPIYKRMYKLCMYSISLGLFEWMGVTFHKERFSKVQMEILKSQYTLGPDFFHCVIDTILFLAERGYQCMKIGSIEPIFHSEDRYAEWYDKAAKTIAQSDFISNPEVHGIDIHKYLGDLDDQIEQGKSIRKYAKTLGSFEFKMVNIYVSKLEFIRSEYLTRKGAMQERKAPFSILFSGGSCVGKSLVMKLAYVHYGKIMGLEIGDEYRYVRNPVDPYWVNFNTSQWAVQMDDIAFMRPGATSAGDPSVMELIQVINNVPFVPTQADLADKGKTPVKCKLVIASTNTEHLNAHAYFSCPLAVRRRLPWVINVKPKPEYSSDNVTIDSSKLPAVSEGEYPNFWIFTIKKVVPAIPPSGKKKNGASNTDDRQRAELVEVYSTDDIYDFFIWFSETAKAYENNQQQVSECDKTITEAEVCMKCMIPTKVCRCSNFQTGPDEVDTDPGVLHMPPYSHLPNFEEWTRSASDYYEFISDQIPDETLEKGVFMTCKLLLISSLFSMMAKYNWFFSFCTFLLGPEFLFNLFKRNVLDPTVIVGFFRYIGWRTRVGMKMNPIFTSITLFTLSVPILSYGVKSILTYMGAPTELDPDEGFVERVCKRTCKCPACKYARARDPMYGYINADMWHDTKAFEPIVGEELREEFREFLDIKRKKMHEDVDKVINHTAKQNSELQSIEDVGKPPVPRDLERPNVWYRDEYNLDRFDLGLMTTSYKDLPPQQIYDIVHQNCIHITFEFKKGEEVVRRQNRAFCIGGHIYMLNRHALPEVFDFICHIMTGGMNEGSTPNLSTLKFLNEFHQIPGTDVVLFRLNCLPPKKNLINLFPKKDIDGEHNGQIMMRNWQGNMINIKFVKAKFVPNHPTSCGPINSWIGETVGYKTQNGDCGGIYVSMGPSGPILLGIHYMGNIVGNIVYATAITQESLSTTLEHVNKTSIVQSGTPSLSSENHKHALTTLHHKSTIRYVRGGTAKVYGSFTGFKAKHRSKVVPSLIQESMKKRGYPIKFGKPSLTSWQPWRRSLLELVSPVTIIPNCIIDHCVEQFYDDIIGKLKQEDLDRIHVYDSFTAINGASEVAYVDSINRGTSAGRPYMCSKKRLHVQVDATRGLQDPIEFTDEVMDRVEECIEKYKNGERYVPIFTAHLKDEPISFKKIEMHKVRVFTGAPVDWSIVVRMYLLSTVVCIQNNKFIFEAGPGTVAQSFEWQLFYEYLTKHGEERIVAGDYAAFDKRMPPAIILGAFRILRMICKKAGYAEEDLRVIDGIAEDTAFPCVDYHGDLMEFFGSNPSGHPLTVIINSLANSIYMRVCYTCLNPENNCKDFQKYVSLMTYGDDNIMGVSTEVPWFNHTNIQNSLGELGIKYTMADKEAASIPYINMRDATFLKRSWRFDADVGAWLAPLDEESIIKMLTVNVLSHVPREQQTLSVMGTACREYFYYGKDVYLEKKEMLLEIAEENDLSIFIEEWHFPTWDSLKEDFWENSKKLNLC
jgi:hypothetical protein